METGTWKVKLAWPKCLRAGLSWTSSPRSTLKSPRKPAPVPSWPWNACRGYSQSRRRGRMADPTVIERIMNSVTIPVMAKCRIGHFVEAQALQAMGVDYVDESEVLTPADEAYHVWKHDFKVPFVCGCRDIGEALRRLHEGAAMIRTKGEAGTGNIVKRCAICGRSMKGSSASLIRRMPGSKLWLMNFACR